VTTDSNLRHQQKLLPRRLAIIVLTTTSWPRIRRIAGEVVMAVDEVVAGSYVVVVVP
jgi:hypothetical protein